MFKTILQIVGESDYGGDNPFWEGELPRINPGDVLVLGGNAYLPIECGFVLDTAQLTQFAFVRRKGSLLNG